MNKTGQNFCPTLTRTKTSLSDILTQRVKLYPWTSFENQQSELWVDLWHPLLHKGISWIYQMGDVLFNLNASFLPPGAFPNHWIVKSHSSKQPMTPPCWVSLLVTVLILPDPPLSMTADVLSSCPTSLSTLSQTPTSFARFEILFSVLCILFGLCSQDAYPIRQHGNGDQPKGGDQFCFIILDKWEKTYIKHNTILE